MGQGMITRRSGGKMAVFKYLESIATKSYNYELPPDAGSLIYETGLAVGDYVMIETLTGACSLVRILDYGQHGSSVILELNSCLLNGLEGLRINIGATGSMSITRTSSFDQVFSGTIYCIPASKLQ